MYVGRNLLGIENYLSWVRDSLAIALGFCATIKHASDGRITACYLAVLFAPCLTQCAIDQHIIFYNEVKFADSMKKGIGQHHTSLGPV